jgi:hypothetical protein
VPDLPTSDQLFAYLERSIRRLTTTDPADFGPIGSRGRALAWNWSFWGRALVFGYRATGEQRYLDLFVEAFAEILDQNDVQLGLLDGAKGSVVPGWGTEVNGVRVNEVTVAGMTALPLCEFMLLLRDDGDASRRYGHLGAQYLAVAEEVVWQYETDYRLSRHGGHYVNPLTAAMEPLNHTHALAAAFAHLWALTSAPRYRTKVDELPVLPRLYHSRGGRVLVVAIRFVGGQHPRPPGRADLEGRHDDRIPDRLAPPRARLRRRSRVPLHDADAEHPAALRDQPVHHVHPHVAFG